MMPGKYKLALVFMLFGLVACESNQTSSKPDDSSFVSRVRDQAVKLEKEGDLSRAVYQWQVITAMQSNNLHAIAELKRLRKLISNKINSLEADFKNARTGSNKKRQKLLALKLLALDGQHSAAREYLQGYEHHSALVMQSEKDRQALQAQARKQEKAQREMAVKSQKQQEEDSLLRAKAESAAKLAMRNARKGDDLYRAGIKALSIDLDKAIALLSESLQYNSDNVQAKQHIQRAKKMQATLRKIEKSKSEG